MRRKPEIYFGNPKGEEDIRQILELQQQNLRTNTTAAEWEKQGFVTVQHDVSLLQRMNEAEPQVIAKADREVVGYALVMPLEFAEHIPALKNMFKLLDTLSFRAKPISQFAYYIMGQVCVAKDYRGQGIFDGLYQQHRKQMAGRYDFVVTEIAKRNPRSLRAHARVGFQTIHRYRAGESGEDWEIVLWDWTWRRPC